MTNVSKQPLPANHRLQLFKRFSGLFISAGENKMASVFMELFTEAEQIMFIKRVGIIFMLQSDSSSYEIAKTLLVSESTVKSIKQKMMTDEFTHITNIMCKKTFNQKQFWQVIDKVLRAGLPPRGPGRWKPVIKMLKK